MTQKKIQETLFSESMTIGKNMTGVIQTDRYVKLGTVLRLLGMTCHFKGCDVVLAHGLTKWCPEHRALAYEKAQKKFQKRKSSSINPLFEEREK